MTIPRWLEKWRGFFLLTRPINVVIAMATIWVGIIICDGARSDLAVLWACLSGGVLTAAANAVNDYFDAEIDRTNKPFRPVPAGMVTKRQALGFAWLGFGVGILLSAMIHWKLSLVTTLASGMMYLYSAVLKRTVLWGNLMVSLLTAMSFIYAGLVVGNLRIALIPASFAFLMHFGREIIKDIEDMEGDRKHGAMTFPVRHGIEPAVTLITLVFIVLMVVLMLPFVFNIYGKVYLLMVGFGVITILFYCLVVLWKQPTPVSMRKISAILKADMAVGLLAILMGRM